MCFFSFSDNLVLFYFMQLSLSLLFLLSCLRRCCSTLSLFQSRSLCRCHLRLPQTFSCICIRNCIRIRICLHHHHHHHYRRQSQFCCCCCCVLVQVSFRFIWIVFVIIFVSSPSPPTHHPIVIVELSPSLSRLLSYNLPFLFVLSLLSYSPLLHCRFIFCVFYSFHACVFYFKLLIWLIHFVRWTELKANKRQHLAFHIHVLVVSLWH